ncbi:CmpA/NrtA family ABC transporter substrate-binding protein [Desulfosediminicola sp.]|uniref:CmpA/NrtA family ABC transporter substrate-binding protein n=1 Tax=Desulfosediminicola sp. TaxID=2886825 RepID=UPI003AF261C2
MRNIGVICIYLSILMAVFCTNVAAQSPVPTLNMSYIFTTHHTPLMVAAEKGELFKTTGAYLEEIVPKQRYSLKNVDGKELAVFNLIVSKSGSETTTLFAMNKLDLGLASSTAFISGIDKGAAMKILCPLHVDGLSMVFPKDSDVNSYADLERLVATAQHPVKIGYHSPTSAPRVVFEGALHEAGFTITGNPNNADADILMVDLKSTANLIPALVSGQVDAWVGPAPFPAVAEHRGAGHVGLDSRALPPAGQWTDFPCCVLGASEKVISEHPEVVQAVTNLLTAAADWSNSNPPASATISSAWIGVPAEAVAKSSIIFTTNPTESWLRGEGIFLSVLNEMDKLRGSMKDAEFKDVSPLLYDFSFIEKSLSAQ